jgi:hypothetical protein
MSEPPLINRDEEHLRLLAIGHYVFGGFVACVSCLGLLYVFFGLVMTGVGIASHKPGGDPPVVVGLIMVTIGGLITVIGLTIGLLMILVGQSLTHRKRYFFCIVMSALACLSIPFGTVLGVFTIIVLARPSVVALFRRTNSPA